MEFFSHISIIVFKCEWNTWKPEPESEPENTWVWWFWWVGLVVPIRVLSVLSFLVFLSDINTQTEHVRFVNQQSLGVSEFVSTFLTPTLSCLCMFDFQQRVRLLLPVLSVTSACRHLKTKLPNEPQSDVNCFSQSALLLLLDPCQTQTHRSCWSFEYLKPHFSDFVCSAVCTWTTSCNTYVWSSMIPLWYFIWTVWISLL